MKEEHQMLSGLRIKEEIAKGNILFDPYNPDQVNSNSYNVKLHNELLVYDLPWDGAWLDMKQDNPTRSIKIPECGIMLKPGILYLGRTVEYTETYDFVPCFDGRSSGGRLGISVHETAGFGDDGFCGYWTLEISVVHPTIIYPFVQIGQIYFYPIERATNETLDPNKRITYNGKYQNNKDIQSSMMWKELAENT